MTRETERDRDSSRRAAQMTLGAALASQFRAGRGTSQDRQPFTIVGRAASVMAADRQICMCTPMQTVNMKSAPLI